jgi:catechol 2,3-dioxygenase-like lactoylglutathione lyase family enzyme
VFEGLDYLYLPSRDVAADLRFFEEVLGARVIFAIDGMGTRVAMVELAVGEAAAAPRILLSGHLEGHAPVLVYRVPDLDAAVADLRGRGWTGGTTLEIPQGPVVSFTAPGGQRIALYELTRPGVVESSFEGRRDF